MRKLEIGAEATLITVPDAECDSQRFAGVITDLSQYGVTVKVTIRYQTGTRYGKPVFHEQSEHTFHPWASILYIQLGDEDEGPCS